ncbi:MAG: aspartate-semialdehyde dehydrogenase [Ferruginibacter sp.]|nr:aspartate-semialdehyde dehydrogenase [Ferruginibacter sp.]
MKVAVVGATGLVGGKMLEVLEEKNFPITEMIPVASEKSLGKKIRWKDTDITVVGIKEAIAKKPEVALFSAGGNTSLTWAPQFVKAGIRVIDNSSAWRMDDTVPLIVPEINGDLLTKQDYLIANPNCSTIQLVMVLNPLNRRYGLDRVVVSTYQSVSGAGAKGIKQLTNERQGIGGEIAFPYPIDLNAIPQIDIFLENDYTKEEMKMINESRKILQIPHLKLTATCVRVPVLGGHSESVNITFKEDFDIGDVKQILSQTPGVIVVDNPAKQSYPMPLLVQNKDETYVGRIRRDESNARSLNCWIVSDNLRKGAATNAVQIALLMKERGIIG